MSHTKTHKLKVTGARTIHCAGCEHSLKFALSNLPGVQDVDADRDSQMIEVTTISDETDLDKIKAELDWLGYEVMPA